MDKNLNTERSDRLRRVMRKASYYDNCPEEYRVICGIYMIRCLVNDKVYIGSSVNMQRRIRKHVFSLREGNHHNYLLQRAWIKYGGDMFVWEVLEYVCNSDVLGKLEDEYTLQYKSSDIRFGFNLKVGDRRISEETRKKMSDAHLGKSLSESHRNKIRERNIGRVFSEEHRQKISEAHLGKKMSEETKRKMSELRRGKKHSEEHNKKVGDAKRGIRRSEETKKKLREVNLGKKHTEETKQKISKSRTNRVFLEYNGQRRSRGEWAKITGISEHAIKYRIKSGYTVEQALTVKGSMR